MVAGMWYGNVVSTQQLALDAFVAVNNPGRSRPNY
jgi:hypothetical protein